MKLISRSDVKAFNGPGGEAVFQFTARQESKGASKNHSVAVMTLEEGAFSDPHAHKVAEESFYILNGTGRMIVAEQEFSVKSGDCVYVQPGERHQLVNTGRETLECLITTSPPWNPDDSVNG
jgi:mannose-6-phosphate isomerase-like protein (cupin superfamily)